MAGERTPKRTMKRTPKRTKNTPSKAVEVCDVGKQPASSVVKSARTPAKRVRKPRKLTYGAKLRRELGWPGAPAAAEALLVRVERTADRLEVLGRLLDGDPNAWMAVRVQGQVVEVRVDGVLVEERQLSEVLRKLIADIGKLRAASEEDGAGDRSADNDDPVVRIVSEHYGRKRA